VSPAEHGGRGGGGGVFALSARAGSQRATPCQLKAAVNAVNEAVDSGSKSISMNEPTSHS